MQQQDDAYPARLDIDYPEEGLDRVRTLFRIILLIPILVVAALVTGAIVNSDTGDWMWLSGGGILFLPTLLMLLFRRKYPRWWFDWHLELSRFSTRVWTYVLLLRDEYPSTDEAQAVHLDLDYPDAERDLNRFLPIVKWLLAIPHYVVLVVLWIGALLVTVGAWFAILDHGPLPALDVRLRAGREPLVAARGGLYVAAHHRPLPALPLRAVGSPGRRARRGADLREKPRRGAGWR